MTETFTLITLLMASLGVSSILRLPFTHALPMTVLGIMVALYVSYILGLLHLAWWGLVAVCLVLGLLGFAVRVRRESLPGAFAPPAALLSFLIAVGLVAYFTAGRHVAGHDELRLWGAYPKLLFFDGRLLVGSDSLLMGEMQTYTPGLPLLGYFAASFDSVFSDEILFFALGVFVVSLLSPISARTSWSRPEGIVIAGVSIALIPLAFANNLAEAGADFYSSLFSDPVVGVLLGYSLWLTTPRIDHIGRWCLQVGLAVAGLYLVKTSGLGLGMVVLVLAVLRWIPHSRIASWKSRISHGAALVGPLAITAGSWTWIQARLGPESKFDADGLTPTLDVDLARQFGITLLARPEFAPGLGIFQPWTSFIALDLAILAGLGYLVIALRGTERARAISASVVGLVMCQIMFLFGIYALVVGPFEGRFLSFPRYSATMLTAASVLLVLLASTNPLPSPSKSGTWASGIACAGAAFLLLSFPLRVPITFVGGWEEPAAIQANKVGMALGREGLGEARAVVTLLFQEDSVDPVGHHHGVYYQLIGSNVRVDLRQPAVATAAKTSGREEDRESAPAYKLNTPPGMEEFRQYLLDNEVLFVVVAEDNPQMADEYAAWFDRRPRVNDIYRVLVDGADVQFQWVA